MILKIIYNLIYFTDSMTERFYLLNLTHKL